MIVSSKKTNSLSFNVENKLFLKELKLEKDLLLRYFLWEAMVESGQFPSTLDQFICLIDLVFHSKEKNVNLLFNRGVFQNDKNIIDFIRIGYSRATLIQAIRNLQKGENIIIPKRENFKHYVKITHGNSKAISLLKKITAEVRKLPNNDISNDDLFNRFGAWINACRNQVFENDVEEVKWFLKYVIQEKDSNLTRIYKIKPAIKYSEKFMRKKLEDFVHKDGKVDISHFEKLENFRQLEKKYVFSDMQISSEKKNDLINEKNKRKEKTNVLKNFDLFNKLKHNNELLTLDFLKDNSSFSVCVEENQKSLREEILYLYRVIFLPLKMDGFFVNEQSAQDFFIYKMTEILNINVNLVLEIAKQAGIILNEPQKIEEINFEKYFAIENTANYYEIYKRFREKDFNSKRYKIVDHSKKKLYFLNMNYGFKEQKDLHFAIRSNSEISKFNTISTINERKESDTEYKQIGIQSYDIGCFSCFLVENEEIHAIGIIEITELNKITNEYNLAYMLKTEYQGKLLGHCITQSMIDYVGLLRSNGTISHPVKLIAIVHRDNIASIALVKKLGFKQIIGPNHEQEFYSRGMICFKFLLEI